MKPKKKVEQSGSRKMVTKYRRNGSARVMKGGDKKADFKRRATFRRDGSLKRDVVRTPSEFEVDREGYETPSKSVTRYNRDGSVKSTRVKAKGRGVSDTPIRRVNDKTTFTKQGTVRTNKKKTTYKRRMK